jgi:pantothenate kinase
MMMPALFVSAISIGTGVHIFFVKEPKTKEDKMIGGLLLTGGLMLAYWPAIQDKLVWG